MNVIGKVENILEAGRGYNEKFKNNWIKYNIKVDGIWYSGFANDNTNQYEHYAIGDNIELEYVINVVGDKTYNNIKTIKENSAEADRAYDSYIETGSVKSIVSNKSITPDYIFSGEFDIDGEEYEIFLKKK